MTNQQAPDDPKEALNTLANMAMDNRSKQLYPRFEAPSESWEKEIEDILGLEEHLGDKRMFLIRNEQGVVIEGINMWPEVEELAALISKVRASAVLEALEKVTPCEGKEIYRKQDEAYERNAWNDCRAEVLSRIEAIKKGLTDPK